MSNSQPLDPKKFGMSEDEIKSYNSRTVIKTEIVDEMFGNIDKKISLLDRIRWIPRRINDKYYDIKWFIKNIFIWSKTIGGHRPWDTRYGFLPIFIKHLEMYIDVEKRFGNATEECKEHKISTAQETLDILKRLLEDDYNSIYTNAVEGKWGKFKYEKNTYSNGSVGFKHLTPKEYDDELSDAYEKARGDMAKDLKRLGELIEKNILGWWD